MSVAQRLVEERKLDFRPTFLFPVLSSLGIMNADMKQLKLMVERFREHQKGQPPSPEGIDAKIVKGRFKVQLKNSICFALVRGNALSLFNQGVNGGVTTPS